MIFLLSPAKTLDYDTPAHVPTATQPLFSKEAAQLIEVLREKSPAEIASLMKLSDKLAALNVARYAAWRPRFTAHNSKQAVLAFDGDVYGGLDARTLDAPDLAWAQQHLLILSGLYGALRPLDRMQPYRLEMGTRLANPRGQDLYAWWGDRLSRLLDRQLKGHPAPVVVNLASQEYFRSVDLSALKAPVVHCVFEDWQGGAYKVVGIHAKRARGAMARHAILKRAQQVDDLLDFDAGGYVHDAGASGSDRLVFRRRS